MFDRFKYIFFQVTPTRSTKKVLFILLFLPFNINRQNLSRILEKKLKKKNSLFCDSYIRNINNLK